MQLNLTRATQCNTILVVLVTLSMKCKTPNTKDEAGSNDGRRQGGRRGGGYQNPGLSPTFLPCCCSTNTGWSPPGSNTESHPTCVCNICSPLNWDVLLFVSPKTIVYWPQEFYVYPPCLVNDYWPLKCLSTPALRLMWTQNPKCLSTPVLWMVTGPSNVYPPLLWDWCEHKCLSTPVLWLITSPQMSPDPGMWSSPRHWITPTATAVQSRTVKLTGRCTEQCTLWYTFTVHTLSHYLK